MPDYTLYGLLGVITLLLIFLLAGLFSLIKRNRLTEQDQETEQNLKSDFDDILADLRSQLVQTLAYNESKTAEIERLTTDLKEAQHQNISLERALSEEKATSKERLLSAEARLTEAKDFNDNQARKFREIMTETVKSQSAEVTKLGASAFQERLTPLKELINSFQKEFRGSCLETTKERQTLLDQVKALMEKTDTVSSEANALTKALKGDNKQQGNWGEVILERVLELSGMEKGREYQLQTNLTSEDGRKIIPDAVIKLPDNRNIIIDSKVSLIAYENYQSCENDTEAKSALTRHLASIRAHIKNLGDKNYSHALEGAVDFVVMFVPIEGALTTALASDNALTEFAAKQNVILSPPNTLLALLKVISQTWRVERRNQNAAKIAAEAGGLYDKIVLFIEQFDKIGKQLETVNKSYSDAYNKLSKGSGNIVRRTEKLEKLGAQTSKQIPRSYAATDDDISVSDTAIEQITNSSAPVSNQKP